MLDISKIADGPAGSTQVRHINDIIVEQLTQISGVVDELVEEGHTIIGVRSEPSGGLPTVQLANSEVLARMVERNDACYYRRRSASLGTYLTGQFQRRGVRVVWVELEAH